MNLENIVEAARQQNKNILIIATPRSGTHALGSLFGKISGNNLGEICKNDGTDPLIDIQQMYKHDHLKIAHIVQLSAKIVLSCDLKTLKQHTLIVNLKRQDKVAQFASWMYFHHTGGVNGKWHNHTESDTKLSKGSITASAEDIDLFITEQLTDNFFCPEYILYYENLNFEKSLYKKNRYNFDLAQIFSNLDYVQQRLAHWTYHND
jgi:hypothetical protein